MTPEVSIIKDSPDIRLHEGRYVFRGEWLDHFLCRHFRRTTHELHTCSEFAKDRLFKGVVFHFIRRYSLNGTGHIKNKYCGDGVKIREYVTYALSKKSPHFLEIEMKITQIIGEFLSNEIS